MRTLVSAAAIGRGVIASSILVPPPAHADYPIPTKGVLAPWGCAANMMHWNQSTSRDSVLAADDFGVSADTGDSWSMRVPEYRDSLLIDEKDLGGGKTDLEVLYVGPQGQTYVVHRVNDNGVPRQTTKVLNTGWGTNIRQMTRVHGRAGGWMYFLTMDGYLERGRLRDDAPPVTSAILTGGMRGYRSLTFYAATPTYDILLATNLAGQLVEIHAPFGATPPTFKILQTSGFGDVKALSPGMCYRYGSLANDRVMMAAVGDGRVFLWHESGLVGGSTGKWTLLGQVFSGVTDAVSEYTPVPVDRI